MAFESIRTGPAAWLSGVGVKPYVTVTRPDGTAIADLSVTVHTVKGGNAKLVTLIRQPVGFKAVLGADGVLRHIADESGGKAVETSVVDLTALGGMQVYDMRKGQPVTAAASKVTVDVPASEAVALTVLPYAVTGIDVTATVADRLLTVTWKVKTGGPAIKHAVRINICNPLESRMVPDPMLSLHRMHLHLVFFP